METENVRSLYHGWWIFSYLQKTPFLRLQMSEVNEPNVSIKKTLIRIINFTGKNFSFMEYIESMIEAPLCLLRRKSFFKILLSPYFWPKFSCSHSEQRELKILIFSLLFLVPASLNPILIISIGHLAQSLAEILSTYSRREHQTRKMTHRRR